MTIAVKLLETEYPNAKCSLDYEDPYQLLISTRLSAQCTDARVNMVTPKLFQRFPTPKSLSEGTIDEIEELIKTCGLYKTKAKDLKGIGEMLSNEFGGKVPGTMEELLKLPGVGRKTANLVLGDIFNQPAVVADTHFIRLCGRMGFLNTKDPLKVETAMRKILPPEKSNDFCHRAVLHGRAVCTARRAYCEKCCLFDVCDKKIKLIKS